jgi:hypothetical protein
MLDDVLALDHELRLVDPERGDLRPSESVDHTENEVWMQPADVFISARRAFAIG